jgi:hypothetical protein
MAVNNLNSGVGIQPTIVDAKGDLIAATANDAVNRLAVGTNGQVLVADSGETTGLKWNNPGTVGGLVHINTTSFSAVASQAVESVFSSTYKNYLIVVNITAVSADASVFVKLRSNTTDASANYSYASTVATENTDTLANERAQGVTTGWAVSSLDAGSNQTGYYGFNLSLYNPFLVSVTTQINQQTNLTSVGNLRVVSGGGYHSNVASYNGINVIASSGNITGSIKIYGYKE